MNDTELLALYSHAEPFDDEHFDLKTFEIYVSFDHIERCTRVRIINADTRHECLIYLDYIQPVKNLLFEAARTMIKTNLLI